MAFGNGCANRTVQFAVALEGRSGDFVEDGIVQLWFSCDGFTEVPEEDLFFGFRQYWLWSRTGRSRSRSGCGHSGRSRSWTGCGHSGRGRSRACSGRKTGEIGILIA